MPIEAPCQVVIIFQIIVLKTLKSNMYTFIQVKIHIFILSFTLEYSFQEKTFQQIFSIYS